MPLDPKNRSGADSNTVPYFRNDLISPTVRPNNPATFDRAESHKNSPHYSGDNAREILYPESTPPYDNPYKQVEGVLDIGPDNVIWMYDDDIISSKLRVKISERFNVNPLYVKVIIDRVKGKIMYRRTQYIQAAKVDEVKYSALEKGQKFQFGADAYNQMSDQFKAKHDRKSVWVKVDDTTAEKEDGSATHHKMLGDYGVIVYRTKKKDSDFAETVLFSKLPQMHGFVFVDKANIPQILQKWYMETYKKEIPYDTIFQKVGKKIKYKGKMYSIDGDPDVIDKGEYEERYKYKTEDIEDALNSFFFKYKKYKSQWGETVKLPYDDFMKAMAENNVSEAKLNSLSKTKGRFWVGGYNGEQYDYMWVYDIEGKAQEIEVTRS